MIEHHKGYLSPAAQRFLLREVMDVVKRAPLEYPCMPRSGRPFQYQMTNCGRLGWYADINGYGYSPRQTNMKPWPEMPVAIEHLGRVFGGPDFDPQSCLINVYRMGQTLGWHQDKDEFRFDRAIVSVSLADTGEFRVAGLTRPRGNTSADDVYTLRSGDVLVMGGDDRMRYHCFTGITEQTQMLKRGGRVNLTIRQVN
jgi:alkylated DNA repair protein (DNA oxidative demethylase)